MFPDVVEPANVGLYLTTIGLEAVVIVEHSLWQAIHVAGAIDMQRVKLEFLYTIEIRSLILREMAKAIRSDVLYLLMQTQMILAHFIPLFAQDPPPPPLLPPLPKMADLAILSVIPMIDLEEDGVVPIIVL